MYAKLVVGGTAISGIAAMRDICRLITSATPSTNSLGGFSTTSSVIVDATPAGWTYVGGNRAADQPTIAATGAATTLDGSAWNLCCSAPCLSGTTLKYAIFNPVGYTTFSGITGFTLTGASSASAVGVVTNEGPRIYQTATSATSTAAQYSLRLINKYVMTNAGGVIHVIANQRHITIIMEKRGLSAIWESSMTDAHTYYSAAPFVQYCHNNSLQPGSNAFIIPTVSTTGVNNTGTTPVMSAVFNITDPNFGTVYGTSDPFRVALTYTMNQTTLYQTHETNSDIRSNTIDSSGTPLYTIHPVSYGMSWLGYPNQSITGVVPIYWTNGSIGLDSADSIDISGDTYYYFNCGYGFGVFMKTE